MHALTSDSELAWIAGLSTSLPGLVAGLIPAGFQGYVRVLHRATGPDTTPVRWKEVADHTGRQLHPLAQFTAIAVREVYDSREPSGWPGENPPAGLPRP